MPGELQGLMQIEEMLISQVMPMMTLYRLPHGQYGYRGHIINLPQDISSFATSLPRLPLELDVVLVRREGANGSHKDFRVRRSKILGALEWLQQHNMYNRDITLDQDALSQLPEDGDLADLATVTLEDPIADEEPLEQSDDPYNAFLVGSFVPVNHRKNTEQEIVQQAVAQGNSDDQPVLWPQISGTPINEFHTEGYFTCAFPTLFPTGSVDFSAPRLHPVTIGYYFNT